MAVRYRPRFPRSTSTPPRPTRPGRLFWNGAEPVSGGSETRLQTFPCRPYCRPHCRRHQGQGRGWSLVAPPCRPIPGSIPGSGPAAPAGTNKDGDAAKAGRKGARQNSKPRVRIGSARGMNHGQAAVDSAPRLGNKRIGSDSGPNRNVPPGVLSRPAKNPQAIGTIRWSLVAGVLEFCRATRDSLLESCRANY